MRQDDGVRRGVREVQRASERVAELVVQRHRRRAEHRPAQPGAVLGLAARVEVGAVGDHARERRRQCPGALLGHQRDDRRRVGGVEALDGVGDRVHAAGGREVRRQAQRQLRVVDDAARQHPRVASGALLAALGQPPHRCHLRARVGRGDGENRQPVLECDRLAQAHGRAAADGDATVGAQFEREVPGAGGHLDRHVHPRLREHPDRPLPQRRGDEFAGIPLLRGAEHQDARQPQRGDLAGELRDRAGADDDAHRQRLVGEAVGHGGRASPSSLP